jgi:hypothetical protein
MVEKAPDLHIKEVGKGLYRGAKDTRKTRL